MIPVDNAMCRCIADKPETSDLAAVAVRSWLRADLIRLLARFRRWGDEPRVSIARSKADRSKDG